MSLIAGSKLGAYEILGPIGAGGMGEVYRARDTQLERDVAIKVLPRTLAGDPERLARFDYNINYHNYDVTADGKRFLVNTNGSSLANASTAAVPPLKVMVNWNAEAKK